MKTNKLLGSKFLDSKFLFGILMLTALSACFESSRGPEGVLTNFIEMRFKGESLEDLKGVLTENFQTEIADYLKEDSKYYTLSNLKKSKLRIVSKTCTDSQCSITYYISYYTLGQNKKKDFSTETKKIAQLQKIGEDWKINKIAHVKTFHDAQTNIEIGSGQDS